MVDLDGKNILVTGGCGFIGSNFIEYILKNYVNIHITNIDKMGIGSREFYPTLVNGNTYFLSKNDIRLLNNNYLSNIKLPNMEYDYVFHFAAESHVDRSISGAMGFISNNVVGITSLLDYVKEFSPKARIINVSTDEVYGHLSKYDDPFSETSHINPRSPYSASKASADLIANAYCQTYGLDIITTRCCNNYGPHQHREKFIPTILRSLKREKKIPVYGNGENIREWIYVEDHNKSILEIANIGKSGKVYHIKSGVERSNIELIEDILKFGGFYDKLEDVIEFVGDRKGHDFRYALDSFRYIRKFDLSPYDKSLRETIGHYWD